MKLGVIADTHDRLPTMERAIQLFVDQRVDAILHAGDFVAPFAAKRLLPPYVPESIPVHCCFGNNDGEREGLVGVLPQLVDGPVRAVFGGCTVVMDHFIDWLKPQAIAGADVVVTGHTHAVVNETRDGVLYLNPGECCGWLNGRCTVAVLETAPGNGGGPTARIIDITP